MAFRQTKTNTCMHFPSWCLFPSIFFLSFLSIFFFLLSLFFYSFSFNLFLLYRSFNSFHFFISFFLLPFFFHRFFHSSCSGCFCKLIFNYAWVPRTAHQHPFAPVLQQVNIVTVWHLGKVTFICILGCYHQPDRCSFDSSTENCGGILPKSFCSSLTCFSLLSMRRKM